jgi:nucleoside-diphosphate-sugar epimerase
MYNKIFIIGDTGFVGKNLTSYFQGNYQINAFKRNQAILTNENIVIHLAGKAHDLGNIANPDEYYQVNTELTKKVFDAFLVSEAKVFLTLSSVKAIADVLDYELTEDYIPQPKTHYGKSKLLAEQYILSKEISAEKRIYILRPCMIHGPGNKGNLNLLYKIVSKGMPWPLGAFENKRSFCSIDNLCFIIKELIENDQIPSGVYNIADDDSLSTNELINLISESQNKNSHIWNVPKSLINTFAKIGDILKLPLNSERLVKLTESYVVSNSKIKNAINKPFPLSSREGLKKTLNSFKIDAQ